MPQFEVEMFAPQLFWLFVVTLCSYLFNKFFFVPHIRGSIGKRERMIEKHLDETQKMQENIASLRSEIVALEEKSKHDTRNIRENAMLESRRILVEYSNKLNKTFMRNVEKCDRQMQEVYEDLLKQADVITDEIKGKVMRFVNLPYK